MNLRKLAQARPTMPCIALEVNLKCDDWRARADICHVRQAVICMLVSLVLYLCQFSFRFLFFLFKVLHIKTGKFEASSLHCTLDKERRYSAWVVRCKSKQFAKKVWKKKETGDATGDMNTTPAKNTQTVLCTLTHIHPHTNLRRGELDGLVRGTAGGFGASDITDCELVSAVLLSLSRRCFRRWDEPRPSTETEDELAAESPLPIQHRATDCLDALLSLPWLRLSGNGCESQSASRERAKSFHWLVRLLYRWREYSASSCLNAAFTSAADVLVRADKERECAAGRSDKNQWEKWEINENKRMALGWRKREFAGKIRRERGGVGKGRVCFQVKRYHTWWCGTFERSREQPNWNTLALNFVLSFLPIPITA